MSNVRVFKLITGEEVVGSVVDQTDDAFIIEDTVAIVMQPTQDGRISPGFFPWLSMIEGAKTIKERDVICYGYPESQLLNAYQSMFSKIITPKKGIIV